MDGRALVDPELLGCLELLPSMTVSAGTLAAARAQWETAAVVLSDDVSRTDHRVSADPEVLVRVHRAGGSDRPRPCVYAIHGGGYVLGSFAMDDLRFDRWCPRFDIIGVSVEYRLAPETPFPGPLDDCYAGLVWVHANAGELGIDPGAIGVFGSSAGGGLAAALCLLARERGGPPIAFQLLEAPMLDDRQTTESSRMDGVPVWNRESNDFGWRSYLGTLYGQDVPALAAPARAIDLSGLPTACVTVGTADLFRDECAEYAACLRAAGVPTELHIYPGAPHGFQLCGGTALARQCARDTNIWLAAQLGR